MTKAGKVSKEGRTGRKGSSHTLRADAQITEIGINPQAAVAGGCRKVVSSKHLYLSGCLTRRRFYPTRRTFGAQVRGSVPAEPNYAPFAPFAPSRHGSR
jgi:hypothetical protein